MKPLRSGKARLKGERAQSDSGGFYLDSGLAEVRSLKRQLAAKITEFIDQKSWTQPEAARRIGIDQPQLSKLSRGRVEGFSSARLFAILNRLGHSVEVRISAKERSPEQTHIQLKIV